MNTVEDKEAVKSELFIKNNSSEINLSKNEWSLLKINYLKGLKKILLNVFSQTPTKESFSILKPYERILLKTLMQKKNFPVFMDDELNEELFNRFISTPLTKKKEYCTKFVIMRSLNHLKTVFFQKKIKLNPFLSSGTSKFIQSAESMFYEHYFGEIAKRKNIPIESFFGFKNWTHRHNSNIPKSITSRVLFLWGLNPNFISEMRAYMKNEFLDEFMVFNENKIIKLLLNWDKTVTRFGVEAGIKAILKSFQSKGCKLPWTLSEAKSAIRITDRILIGE
jgi:hypothetical protein